MFKLSFKRGVHLDERKNTSKKRIEKASIPEELVIQLKQHIGMPAEAIVNVEDNVKKYQLIGKAQGKCSANIHAPTSGIVTAIEKRINERSEESMSIVIKTDGKDESIKIEKINYQKINEYSNEKLREIIREAGVVGLGGACFPTDVKLEAKNKIDLLILNGCECEPIITADHRMLLEHPSKVVEGLSYLMKASNVNNAIIGIEDNKKNTIHNLNRAIESLNEREELEQVSKLNIKVKLLKTKYPQGAEKMLIYALTKKKVPCGGYPSDIGIIVNNVSTAKAVYDAVVENKALIDRIVTVTGEVNEEKNLKVLIGTKIKDVINDCNGFKTAPKKIIVGGPMMGNAQTNTESSISKGSSCVIVESKPENLKEYGRCIRCGKCINVCPMNLMPTKLAQCGMKRQYGLADKMHIRECFECGSCTVVCPAKIPLVQIIRLGKRKVNETCKI